MEHTWTKDFYQETDPAKRQQILKEHIGEEEAWEEEYRDRLWTARYGQRRLQKDEFVKCLMEIYSGKQRRQRIYLSGIRHGTIVRRRNREKNRRTDQCDRVQGTTPASHGKRIHPAPGSRSPGISAGVSEQGAFPE